MNILNVSHVVKHFGAQTVINDLTFSVKENTIYGFIGQNGAGKTTTMKMILGLYSVDSGTITVNGEAVKYGQTATNRFIGYLPDVPEFYGYMTPKEYLLLCAKISTVIPGEKPPSDSILKERIATLLDLVGLGNTGKRIHGFSRGMKQRLGIAAALLNEPKLLICDEPTSALDPIGRKEILDILLQIKERTTVVFSTHILSDVERICDEIGLLHQGKLQLQGSLEEIKSLRKSDGFDIEFTTPEDLECFQVRVPGGIRAGKTTLEFAQGSTLTFNEAMKHLLEQNLTPLRVEQKEPTLESLFMEVTST